MPSSPGNQPRRTAVRVIIVFALVAYVLLFDLPDLRRIWSPLGEVGLTSNLDNVITSVAQDSPAARAGVQAGDRIDLAATDPQYRFWMISGTSPETPRAGQTLSFAIDRAGVTRTMTMVSAPEPLTPTTKTLLVARELSMLLFVGIGAALVLLRPSIATWAFFMYCLGGNGAPAQVFGLALGLPWNYICGIFGAGLISAAAIVGVIVFAALFLHEDSEIRRTLVLRIAPIAWLAFTGLFIYGWIGAGYYGQSGFLSTTILLLGQVVAIAVALYFLISTYVAAKGSDRQRIRWIVAGFSIALLAVLVQNVLTDFFAPPYWLYASLLLVPIAVPLTVGYAVIKHRVIDVSFVVSRALVYGILTTVLVGVFSLIDWFFTDYLRLARLGAVAEVGAVVAFGLWFNGLHRRVDSFIDATFFRQRHRAELALAEAAAALPLASSTGTVAHFLVQGPMRTLDLASAALFRREDDGIFVQENAEGWPHGALARLEARDEPLLLLAQTRNGPLPLHDHPWREEELPKGAARPALALPIIVRRELTAIAFYGAHRHGEALDPDEIKAIGWLATGAAAAYDHLDAEMMRRELESARALLAEAQIQPA